MLIPMLPYLSLLMIWPISWDKTPVPVSLSTSLSLWPTWPIGSTNADHPLFLLHLARWRALAPLLLCSCSSCWCCIFFFFLILTFWCVSNLLTLNFSLGCLVPSCWYSSYFSLRSQCLNSVVLHNLLFIQFFLSPLTLSLSDLIWLHGSWDHQCVENSQT